MGDNVKSIAGSTSIGKTLTKYKNWAIPILRTNIKNVEVVYKTLTSKNFTPDKLLKSRELQEILRAISTSSVLIMAGAYILDDDDDSFLGQLKKRAYREAMTILQAIDITMFLSTGRVIDFALKLSQNLKAIVLLEEYTQTGVWGKKGELKGVNGLQRQFTPAIIKQFEPKKPKKKSVYKERK